MPLLALAAALILQAQDPPAVLPAPDPVDVQALQPLGDTTATGVYDTPATRRLVERVIRESGEVPEGLRDYRAAYHTTIALTLASDSAAGGDLPVTVDELAGTVRWSRPGHLTQWVRDHEVRLLVPAPYTLGTIVDEPWLIPHLYGPTISELATAGGIRIDGEEGEGSAIHPFGRLGPQYYRYAAEDTIRVRVRTETVTLVPVRVAPRTRRSGDPPLVVGTFFIDVRRAAVARARFGYVGGARVARTGTYLELENGLWQGRYWLPYRQRREAQVTSLLLGGAVAARIVSELSNYELNTGWTPPDGAAVRLVRDHAPDPAEITTTADAETLATAEWDIGDFADLRRAATGAAEPGPDGLRIGLHVERADHLFRYNRVEGAFLGLGLRLGPAAPSPPPWEIYATGGWAFAEEKPRGEVAARWRAESEAALVPGLRWGLAAAAYRRLRDTRAFEPTFQWGPLYTLPALLGGSDLRDYYDATGVEVGVSADQGAWSGYLGGRWERQDSVVRHTNHYLFGTAEEFPTVAPVQPGTHAAFEGSIAFARGSGAFGIGNSVIASIRGEAGMADFRYGRATVLLSLRRSLGIFTLAGRLDAGHAWGDVPLQELFRFGSVEGLRGFDRNEFGGTSAMIGRGRFLIGLPPYSARPLGRSGIFILPPLRPALVLLGEAGWAEVSERSRPELLLLESMPTGGVRGSLGAGISAFNDFLTLEYVQPLEDGEEGRWYLGLVTWF